MRKVKFNLVGQDGNAFFLMSAWQNAARGQKFDKEYIDNVIEQCMSSDYDNLLRVLMANSEWSDEYDE